LQQICTISWLYHPLLEKYLHLGIGVPIYFLYICHMIIDGQTKISKIINYNEAAIGIIAKINSNFNKLKNPILRKVLAPRVNVNQAAKIGGVAPIEILLALEKIGFQVAETKNEVETSPKEINTKPMNQVNKVTLDVRPILESGEDPFKKIMAQLKSMDPEKALLIINTFEPIPLLNILKDKGYSYETTRPKEGEVHTLLFKTHEEKEASAPPQSDLNQLSFSEIELNFKGKMTEVDVRDLEMPMPMVTILEAIEKIGEQEALYVHHKKLPQYLIPELENRAFSFVSNEIDENNIKLIIFKS
jgi:uncharacterized protein (DUF2249 family)